MPHEALATGLPPAVTGEPVSPSHLVQLGTTTFDAIGTAAIAATVGRIEAPYLPHANGQTNGHNDHRENGNSVHPTHDTPIYILPVVGIPSIRATDFRRRTEPKRVYTDEELAHFNETNLRDPLPRNFQEVQPQLTAKATIQPVEINEDFAAWVIHNPEIRELYGEFAGGDKIDATDETKKDFLQFVKEHREKQARAQAIEAEVKAKLFEKASVAPLALPITSEVPVRSQALAKTQRTTAQPSNTSAHPNVEMTDPILLCGRRNLRNQQDKTPRWENDTPHATTDTTEPVGNNSFWGFINSAAERVTAGTGIRRQKETSRVEKAGVAITALMLFPLVAAGASKSITEDPEQSLPHRNTLNRQVVALQASEGATIQQHRVLDSLPTPVLRDPQPSPFPESRESKAVRQAKLDQIRRDGNEEAAKGKIFEASDTDTHTGIYDLTTGRPVSEPVVRTFADNLAVTYFSLDESPKDRANRDYYTISEDNPAGRRINASLFPHEPQILPANETDQPTIEGSLVANAMAVRS